jgi:hypothetical protein
MLLANKEMFDEIKKAALEEKGVTA